jgi:hypothetical protein
MRFSQYFTGHVDIFVCCGRNDLFLRQYVRVAAHLNWIRAAGVSFFVLVKAQNRHFFAFVEQAIGNFLRHKILLHFVQLFGVSSTKPFTSGLS